MTDNRNGQVVTFYSYKGGTGRTMALANVAWILAANGKKVLTIDWDLESGYNLICYWFNVPYTDTDYGTITIYKYYCPSDFDPTGATKEYAESACTDPHPEIEFGLTPDGGTSQPRPSVVAGAPGSSLRVPWYRKGPMISPGMDRLAKAR